MARWKPNTIHPYKKPFKSYPNRQIVPLCGVRVYMGPLLSLIGKHVYFWHPQYDRPILSGVIRKISPDGKMMYTELRNGGAGWSYIESPYTLILDEEITDIMAKQYGGYSHL